ncbi:MAG: dockerin type I domain-containing protein, partial [Planctomycetota bacterium]|nr:dockerin type I domain-containing protein [Planctomycetota bacterium]
DNDGTARDVDDFPGSVSLPQVPRNFSVFDLNFDGSIDASDVNIIPEPPNPSDLNQDGVVNAADLAILLGSWLTSNPTADVNQDGIVNAIDLGTLLGSWG